MPDASISFAVALTHSANREIGTQASVDKALASGRRAELA